MNDSDDGTAIARMDLWTDDDTAEGGPTLDSVDTAARIEAVESGAMLHTTSVDEAGNLWTIALYLNRSDAAILARDLAAAAEAMPAYHRADPTEGRENDEERAAESYRRPEEAQR